MVGAKTIYPDYQLLLWGLELDWATGAAWGANDGQGNDTGRILHAPAKGQSCGAVLPLPAAAARGYRVKRKALCLPDVVDAS